MLKSPVHTARVSLLLQLFPDAQFIYIHRHPWTVLQSALNMADKTYWYSYLNRPTPQQILDFITNQFELLFDAYEADKSLIPAGNLVEVRFEDLEADLPRLSPPHGSCCTSRTGCSRLPLIPSGKWAGSTKVLDGTGTLDSLLSDPT